MIDPPIIKRNGSLRIPLLASLAVHIFVFAIGSLFPNSQESPEQDLLFISLVDLPRPEAPPPPHPEVEEPAAIKKPPPPPQPKKVTKPKERLPAAKTAIVKPEPPPSPPPAPVKEEPSTAGETKPVAPAKVESAPGFASSASVEGDAATAGLGRGSGSPGLPVPTPLKTDRKARPVKTVRANYPPMALRMGMEGDVTLRIEVDAEGKVTKAEIVKSGGIGFGEEALKAVKQSRFEPAQVDGKNVPAEFTYIYRFRLRR